MHLQPILTYIHTAGLDNWSTLVYFLLGGGLLSALTQIVKKLKAWESADTIHKFLGITTLITTMAQWYLSNYSTHFEHAVTPFAWWIPVTGTLFTVATFAHKLGIRQLSTIIEGYFGPILAARNELKAASKPLPTTPQPEPTNANEVL